MLQILLSGRGRLIAHLSGWTLVSLLVFYLMLDFRPPGEALGRTALFILFPMALFYINARVLTNRFFEAKRYVLWAVLAVALWLGMAALRTFAEYGIFGETLWASRVTTGSSWKMFTVTVIIYFVLMIFSGLYQLLENRHALEAQHATAQLNYLKAQINPHFLFNTLNNIYAAATLNRPGTAEMVLRLSDLLRYVTYDGQSTGVSLAKEIAQINAYIGLFQLKSETALPVTFEVKGDVGKWVIEPLLLLPLVENALKHSDLEQSPSAYVKLSLTCGEKHLFFAVENTFDPENRQKDQQGGVGLHNIRQRLELRYRGRHTFEAKSENNLFVAKLSLEA